MNMTTFPSCYENLGRNNCHKPLQLPKLWAHHIIPQISQKSGMMLVKNWTVFLRLPQVMCFAFHFIYHWSIFERKYNSKCSYYASTFVAIWYIVYTSWKHTFLDPPCLPRNSPRILLSCLFLRAGAHIPIRKTALA
jgi:hypothetical protein